MVGAEQQAGQPAETAQELCQTACQPRVMALLAMAMFLQHFALGAWLVTLGSYLKANSGDAGQRIFDVGFVGVAYGSASVGAMLAPLATGILADRWMRANRVTAWLSLFSALVLWLTAGASSQRQFLWGLVAFFVAYMPTISLLITMILRRLPDPQRQYPRIRACGSLGWIAAGILIGVGGPWFCGESIELTAYPMRIGALAMAALAFVCSIVPDVQVTRPVGGFSWSEVRLLAGRSEIWRLLVIALLASIAPQFYGNYGNVYFNALEIRYAAAKLTLGQVAEVIGILALPSLLARFRVKTLILTGLAMWALRYALLAWVDGPEQTWAVFLAVALHGASFPLASIPLQLEMHRRASDAYRATGQGLLLIAMSGLGALAGASLAGLAEVSWLASQTLGLGAGLGGRWELFWGAPAVGTLVVMGVVIVLWERRDRSQSEKSTEPEKNAGIVLPSGYTRPCP